MSNAPDKKDKKEKKKPTESAESRHLVAHAFDLASQLNISTLLVQADNLIDRHLVESRRSNQKVIWLASGDHSSIQTDAKSTFAILLPYENLSRMDQIQVGLMLAALNGLVRAEETVLCLTGIVGSKRLDNLLITNLKRDNKWFRNRTFENLPKHILSSEVFFRTLDLALRFADEGREGKAMGTIFVLGEPESLDPYLTQLILNPCAGHPKKVRNVHNPEYQETVRELAALDGAFVISQRGVVERAAAYLDPPFKGKKIRVRSGQGARHSAGAAITMVEDSIAIVLSESSGAVTVYHQGSAILELNKSQGPS